MFQIVENTRLKKYENIKFFQILDENMSLYELNKKSKMLGKNGFIFIVIYLKLQIPMMHRHFVRKISQNPEYVQTHCNNINNSFLSACRKWYLFNNPQF